MTDMPQAAETVDFGLRPGLTVEVLTMEGRLAFIGRVERFHDGAVTLRDAKDGELPRVTYNQEIKLRYVQGEDTAMIHGKICGSTEQIWKLDRLESKFFKEQRTFFRQRISTSIQAECFRRSPKGGGKEEGYPCQVVDVSAGGLLFTSSEAFGTGERVLLTGIRLLDTMDPFSFDCVVRRTVETKEGAVRCGCQFEALSPKEQDRLLRAIFAVQREEIRRQRERGGL